MRIIILCLFLSVGNLCFSQYVVPSDTEYVTVKDGHLYQHNTRVRFWGAVGAFPGKSYSDNVAVVKRLKSLGYNLVRFWNGPQSPASGYTSEYNKGDGSKIDLADHFLYCCKLEGIKIWFAGLNQVGKATIDDVNIITDVNNTSNEWKTAVTDKGVDIRNSLARIWDPRLHNLGIARMKAVALHVNQYTGLRYADEPNFVIWELANEEWWFGHVISRLSTVPDFFKKELIQQWNEFLHKKYISEDLIRKAWLGFLPGESFSSKTIHLMPLSKSAKASEQRKALGVNIQDGEAQQYGAYDFNGKRASDVIEFLTSIWYSHKQIEYDAMKKLGKSIALGSLIWDTGIGNEIQSQFLHQQSDAVAHCTYISGFHHDTQAKRFPWFSGLEELPRMTWNDSWLEQNKIEGKPFFVYENQMWNPSKYRAEYPMRLVSLGSINDWDVIVWHYFGIAPDSNLKNPYAQKMAFSSGGEKRPNGLEFEYDEIQQSAMLAASHVFRNFLLKPASNPTVFIFGKNSFLNPASLVEYGGSYGKTKSKFMPTTYRYGSRILIDTTKIEDEIITLDEYKSRLAGNKPNQLQKIDSKWSAGREKNVVDSRVYEINPIRTTNEIEYDWQKGHLIFDAPGVVSYCGFLAQYGRSVSFKNGVVLSNVCINNPKEMPYPVNENEKYIEFSVVSMDGKQIEHASKIIISLVSTSFNSGFKLDHSKIKREFVWGAEENKGMTVDNGHAPVLVARVGATISLPGCKGMKYRMLDFHQRELSNGKLKDGKLKIPATLEVFYVELSR